MKALRMNTNEWGPGFYDELCGWWRGHGWDPVMEVFLPPEGVLVTTGSEEGEVAVAAGFIYCAAGCPLGWLEWVVTRPGLSPRRSVRALKLLVAAAARRGRELGLLNLLTVTRKESLVRLYERAGFIVADGGLTQLSLPLVDLGVLGGVEGVEVPEFLKGKGGRGDE